MKVAGRRRRRLSRLSTSAGGLAVLPLLLLPFLQQAGAFSLHSPSLSKPATTQRAAAVVARAAEEGGAEGGGYGGGYPVSPNYGDEEDDTDEYMKSLKRPEARGPPPSQAGGVPQLSPEEVKRRNEEAKARMEAYSRGELPPALQAWKSGAAPAAPAAHASGQQQPAGGFNPTFWQDFYREHEAKLAAEKAAKEAEGGGSEAAAGLPPPAPTGAPIQPPAPEPVQSQYYDSGAGAGAGYEQQMRQQQRQQAAVDPYAGQTYAEQSPYASEKGGAGGAEEGGSRFKKMLDMSSKAAQGNTAKEKIKQFLLSRYAPDDMSPQAVAFRRLIAGAESGYMGPEQKDEYMENLKKGAKEKAAELYRRVGVPLPPEAAGGGGPPGDGYHGQGQAQPATPGRRMAPPPPPPSALAERGLTSADNYMNDLTRAKQQRIVGGGAPAASAPPPMAAVPPPPPQQQQQGPPAIDPFTGRPAGQQFGVPPPAAYQQPSPPPPPQPRAPMPPPPPPTQAYQQPPPPPPAAPVVQQQRAPDAALLMSMEQLEERLQAHRGGGPGGRLQGEELDRLEHLLREVGALLHEESATAAPQQPPRQPQPPPPPQQQQQQGPPQPAAAPASGYLLPHAARARLLAAADALHDLAGLSQDDAGPAGALLLHAQATGVAETLEDAFKVLDEILGGPQNAVGQSMAAGVAAAAPTSAPAKAPEPAPVPVAAAAPAPAAPRATAAPSTPPPPPKVATVELDKKDRARLQGLMALVLKHSGAFGPSSGPLVGDEKKLLRAALAEMGAMLRTETEGAYGQTVEEYLEAHPETLEQYRQLQTKMAMEGSPFAAPSGPAPASKPARSYKEQLELARKARQGAK